MLIFFTASVDFDRASTLTEPRKIHTALVKYTVWNPVVAIVPIRSSDPWTFSCRLVFFFKQISFFSICKRSTVRQQFGGDSILRWGCCPSGSSSKSLDTNVSTYSTTYNRKLCPRKIQITANDERDTASVSRAANDRQHQWAAAAVCVYFYFNKKKERLFKFDRFEKSLMKMI